MEALIGILSKGLSFIASLFLFLLNIIKYIFVKFWKFILLLGGLFLSLFGIKRAMKKESKS